jgi:metal-responsive CopG/Arc/MetJ family transcriptional regulator
MKTAISVPDDVFDQAEVAAKRLKVSRSELYSRALAEFLARHTPDEVTAALDAAIAEHGQPADELVARASRKVLGSSEW